jgi:hypothetical protein
MAREKPEGGDMENPSVGYVSSGPLGGCVQNPGQDLLDAMQPNTYTAPATGAACHCTGACQRLGYCPCNPPVRRSCGHVFPWHCVIPPTYCPVCGAYIGPVHWPMITYYSTGTPPSPNQCES